MAELNRMVCASDFANTGVGDCPLIPKHIIGMFIVPKDFVLTESDLEDLKTSLEDATKANSQNERILPVHNFVGMEDNSEDLVEETLGYGGISVIREGRYNLTFQLGQGGLCLLNSLRKFNGRPVRVLLYDAAGVLYGYKDGSTIKGIPVELFYALPFTFSDGSGTTTAFRIRLVIDPSYLNDNLAFVATSGEGFLLQEIEGLLDIRLEETTGSANPVLKIKGFAGCGSQNVLKDYATELADEGMWVATNPATGAPVVITSVAINDDGIATVTLDSASDVRLSLVGVTALEAAGVVGYESRPITITQ